ncbi:Cysteine desulfurase [Thioalkalivibrio nitratireducens DSM 14787]|uniref:cysteine desulfurase n=1 Tax=Thioalkalivibrio nitratireducens (strain DSM 14787 / UNIQEM 213 / ALEN2) TaxID=1255043 RepID=L0DWI7_THIND|nr:cysteine desulfurase family protein [Thioalkalivibrio nitratireducens]AGA33340.1 Cysteine desulfurase [Thioalkalivibrio nitratireducens DSM 14787]
MERPIYLDYNATTPIAPEVFEAMAPFLTDHFGNPSSSHPYGKRAAEAVARARGEVAALLGAETDEIVFAGCATEANNLALRGVARALRGKGRHLVTSAVEHPSVLVPCERLRSDGWEVTVLPVDGDGRVDPDELARTIRPDTVLVSIMLANNETGTLQPVAALARIAHAAGTLFHTDAAQAAGKIPVRVDELGIDLLTLAGHKFYAPKGVGALYLRRGTPVEPVLVGAGQEHGLRPGTENTPHLVAMGAAARLAREGLHDLSSQLRSLRDTLHGALLQAIPGLQLNGHLQERLPNTLNLSFPGVSGRDLLAACPGLAASVGSACHEEGDAVSGVLAALGCNSRRARGAVRVSLGRGNDPAQVAAAAQALIGAWNLLAKGSDTR